MIFGFELKEVGSKLIRERESTGPLAYAVDFKVPWTVRVGFYHFRSHFDCDGKHMDHLRAYYYRGFRRITVSAILSMALMYRDGIQLSDEDLVSKMKGVGNNEETGVTTDYRTIEMIIGRCCPPALLSAFLDSEAALGFYE